MFLKEHKARKCPVQQMDLEVSILPAKDLQ